MEEKLKFTQEVKDKWLEALKSGKFKQGQFSLMQEVDGEIRHCCIGVLGEVCKFLNNSDKYETNPYTFLEESIGSRKTGEIYLKNDAGSLIKRDYSNIIPLIESLEVQE